MMVPAMEENTVSELVRSPPDAPAVTLMLLLMEMLERGTAGEGEPAAEHRDVRVRLRRACDCNSQDDGCNESVHRVFLP